MMEFLNFTFASLEHFVGVAILIVLISAPLHTIFRRK